MRVFLDTNVIIDVLAAREPFFRDSQRVVDYCERYAESGFLSSLTFCTAAYVLRKSSDNSAVLGAEAAGMLIFVERGGEADSLAPEKSLDWRTDMLVVSANRDKVIRVTVYLDSNENDQFLRRPICWKFRKCPLALNGEI